MKQILVLHTGEGEEASTLSFLGQAVEVRRSGCGGDPERARRRILEDDGVVDAIGLEGMPTSLQLGEDQAYHEAGTRLSRAAGRTPVVDGSGVRAGVERWAVSLAERAQPGMLAGKRVLMLPGLNHPGLAHSLAARGSRVWYADPWVFFRFPGIPGAGSPATLARVAPATLGMLRGAGFERLQPRSNGRRSRKVHALVRWADVLAGDAATIRAFAPPSLAGKTIVAEAAEDRDLDDFRARGATCLVTLMPEIHGGTTSRCSAALLEALLAAVRERGTAPLTEDTYLDMLSELHWAPAVRTLQPDDRGVNRFAFVIHPLSIDFIHRHPRFRWTRHLPASLVEPLAARMRPMYVSRITGGRSPATGVAVEGHLIALTATPYQMMRRTPDFTYRRLAEAARMAHARGARLMGLGAFTSVVGDAGITVDKESPIAITSGNSLTVAATLEAAKQAALGVGWEDLSRGRAMIVGATGSIGSVCSRMLAQALRDVVLVSIEPEKLIELKRRIREETPGAEVRIATRSDGLVAECDLIVTATSGFGERVVDISQCKPGAIVCDVARPPDVGPAEAALRPDVLVIESGEVLIPGEVDFGYDIGLPPKVAYACLAETALLAMEGRFESFTLGRELRVERVKEIYRLFKKHDFRLAGLRSLGKFLTPSDLAEKQALARELRADPERLARVRADAARRLAELPRSSKGVRLDDGPGAWLRKPWIKESLAALTLWFVKGRGPA